MRGVRARRRHARWFAVREDLPRHHPQSPAPASRRAEFRLRVAPYDPAFRFVVPVLPAEAERRSTPSDVDGVVHQDRIGRVELPGLGTLDVWWVAVYGGGVFLPVR